ncbi:MAG TPA: hypothetical protein PKW18_13125 [Candidatus Sumerlaeota bacterium]|nr:hypothetical protein [Candidatus Sumerlaeota bacterium]
MNRLDAFGGRPVGKETMDCPKCGKDMGDPVDTTYSNTGRDIRPVNPAHTGDIYACEECECKWLHDFISGQVRRWDG